MPNRPHIVLFVADDLSWHDLGPYGSPDVHTPHFDALAQQGLTCNTAIVASPTCAPSRSSMYTGLYPVRSGAHANHTLVNPGVRTLPQYLQSLGYRTVIAGKTHIGPREQFPFEYLADSNVLPPGKTHVLDTDLNTQAVDALLASHDRATPLCLVIGAHSPHVYWAEDPSRYDPQTIHLPPYLVDTPETRQARCRYYADVTHLDAQVGQVLHSLDQHGYAANTLFAFTADHGSQWPSAKWSLYDAGVRVPLLLRWPGRIPANTRTDALISNTDLLPTFIEAAGGTPPPDLDGRSLLPTLLNPSTEHRDTVFSAHTGDQDMNRTPMRSARTARFKYVLNLLPHAEYTTHISHGLPEDGRDYWDSWVARAKTDPRAAAIVERYRHHPAEELYDLRADPYELRNLANDPAHAGTLADLREQTRQWRLQQGEDLTRVLMPEDGRRGPLQYAG